MEHKWSALDYFAVGLKFLYDLPPCSIAASTTMPLNDNFVYAPPQDPLSILFQARTVKKHYIALVQGQVKQEGSVEVPLITDWENRPRQIVHFELGKHAKTLFQPLVYDATTDQSRVLLEPVTGRSHQLRVHMMHIGHPIMGDKLYHPEPKRFHLNRMALHAAYLAFQHPLKGTDVVIESQVPF